MSKKWSTVIRPKSSIFEVNIREIFKYFDLLILLVKRDIVTVYKQTVLGPLWYIAQPLMTTAVFTVIFGKVAKISTDGSPHILFYLLGIVMWNYFSSCLRATSDTFTTNQNIFGKVYFPRVIVPGSVIVSNLIKFSIQFLLFLSIWMYYYLDGKVYLKLEIIYLPFALIIMATLGLGLGLLFSSMTTKYKDLKFLIGFGVQLWMYATPVIYPISAIPNEFKNIALLNPITPLIQIMKEGFLGSNFYISKIYVLYSFTFAITVLIFGFLIFNKVEKKFMDTI